MYEAVRVFDWEQTFNCEMVADLVFEAINSRQEWSYRYFSLAVDGDPLKELVEIRFAGMSRASREDMLLVTPIARREAMGVLRDLGRCNEYLDHMLLSEQLYHLSHGELSLWWLHALNQNFSQLLVDPKTIPLTSRQSVGMSHY